MVNRFACMALALLSAFLFGGSPVQADEPLKVTMIAYPPGDDFYFTVEKSARKQADELGVKLTVQKIPSYDLAAQLAVLNAAIATRPNAIIVSPLDPNGLQAALDKAKSLGIKIVLYDTSTRDMSVAATHVSADVVELGRTAAHQFQRLAGNRTGSVFYQGTAPAQPFFEAIYRGWEEVLGGVTAYKHLPRNYSDFEPAKAASQMEAVLVSNPDLIGGFTGTYLDQEGIVKATGRSGRTADLILIGVDGTPQNVERIRRGELDAIVSVEAGDYGTEAIKAAVAAVAGQQLPAETVIGQCLLTADNLDKPESADCLYSTETK